MRTPAVGILLGIFIGQNCFEGPPMQIEVEHIRRRESVGWDGGDKQFVDLIFALYADGRGEPEPAGLPLGPTS